MTLHRELLDVGSIIRDAIESLADAGSGRRNRVDPVTWAQIHLLIRQLRRTRDDVETLAVEVGP